MGVSLISYSSLTLYQKIVTETMVGAFSNQRDQIRFGDENSHPEKSREKSHLRYLNPPASLKQNPRKPRKYVRMNQGNPLTERSS